MKPLRAAHDNAHRMHALDGRRRLLAAMGVATLAGWHGSPLAGMGPAPSMVSLVVGFPPGGPNDLIARLLAPLLSERLKRNIVVENRSGADGELAASYVARGPADGSMLLFASAGAMTISPAMKKNLPYDPMRDFAPIARVASSPMVMVANPARPYKTAADVIAAARRAPGKITYASAGVGSPTHLAGALLCSLAGIDMLHVPYKGGGPALTDTVGGQVELYFAGVSTALPFIKSGALRALGVTGATPLASLPGVPPLADTPDLKGYLIDNWYGVLAPARLPGTLAASLGDTIDACLKEGDFRKKLQMQGVEPAFARNGQFGALIAADIAKWKALVGKLGISA
ncbi:tripartite tricarboxylate transporter substrate binding protein [Achromobacter aloeverae]|uniref:tripartite tricarboxylate transporter substrate binding protein n=1 Tax=Achromobacter aloeverae TaxID=1750518 RepID=UPI001300D4B4|nr:tripartite tricarboxylate transporter substrate binding protein [Achromobacter aloeverae]